MKTTTFILMFLLVPSAVAQTKLAELAGRPVEMRLAKSDDLSPVDWPVEQIELRQVAATLTRDRNIYMLLQANGIAPDSQAFTLVYDLNPSLTDLSKISPDTSLQLPTISGGTGLRKLLEGGDLVELTVDPEIRLQLGSHVDSLQAFAASINQLTSDSNTRMQLQRLIEWYGQIQMRFRRRTDPPQRRPTLVEMRNEAELLDSLLEGALHQHRQLTSDEQQQVAAVYDDIKLEMTEYGQTLGSVAPRAQSLYSVTVNIKGGDSAYINGLRVYYTYNGLFRPLPAQPPITNFGFSHLGSGTSENLLMKNYQVWAAKDGDSNHPVTPPYLLRIDSTSSGPLSVDLSLTGGTPR